MAQLKKIVRNNPLSSFQQVAPDGGATFRVMAEAMAQANERVEGAAIEQMEQEGAEQGRLRAQQNRVSIYGSGDDIDAFNASLAQTESGGNYSARNSEGFSGKYQFGQERLDDFNRANGTSYSTDDLIVNTPEARELTERVQRWHIGDIDADLEDLVGRSVNGQQVSRNAIRAMAHLGGKGGARRYVESNGQYDPADSNGTKLSDYARIHGGTTTVSTRNAPDAVVRTADGKIEGRRFSPFAGPVLQAHNAAARVAEQAELLNQGQIDLFELSNQYEFDPEGFANAAKGYIEQIVENASPDIRADLTSVLGSEVRRRTFGLMDAQQRDTRNRANNASRALMDRWQGQYAEALATGDPEEIEAARNQLSNVLAAREALPGVAWTPEQSANVFLDAEKSADRLIDKQRKELSAEFKDDFDLIIKAAKEGRFAENEGILDNPEALAMHPELANEAAAFVALRDNIPDFQRLTPAEQAAEIARIAENPVGEEWELDVVDAATDMTRANKKAWDEDPVKRASEVLDTPPPALPDLTPDDPSKFVDALSERREYMNAIRDRGFTETHAYLSGEEAKQIAMLMGKGTDPAIRSAMSAALVAGFGTDAVRVFDEINSDPVTMFAGKLQAVGGDPAVAAAMIRGQQMLDENLVQLPKNADRIGAFDAQMATAFEGIPGALNAQAELMEAAKAIYASQAQGIDHTSDAAKDLFAQSIQIALGQSKNKRGETTGGIQPVMGHPTLLPMGVTGKSVDQALRLAMGGGNRSTGLSGGNTALGAALTGTGLEVDRTAIWESIGVSGGPLFNGKPIPQAYIDNDMIRTVSAGGNLVRLEINNGTSRWDVEDGDGNVLIFDITELLEATE